MGEREKIRIGNQTAFSASYPTEPFEYAVTRGFNAFEWFPDRNEYGVGWDEDSLDADTRIYIKKTAIKNDIAISVHAPLEVNPLNPETHERLFKTIEFAGDVGADLLNIHFDVSEGINAYMKAITPVIKGLTEAGIKLSIENTSFTSPEDFNRLFVLLQNIGDISTKHTGMCLDLGHANIHYSTRNDFLGFIDRLDSLIPIIHIHLHENYGEADSHLPIFTGPAGENITGLTEFFERITKRGFSGNIILEQWPSPRSLLDQARDKVYQILDTVLQC